MTLLHEEVLDKIYEELFEINEDLSQLIPPITLYPDDYTISEADYDNKSFGRVSIITLDPRFFGYKNQKADGIIKISFFYPSGQGQKLPLKWASKIEERFKGGVLDTDEGRIQFKVGNVRFVGLDTDNPYLSHSIYENEFCYFKN